MHSEIRLPGEDHPAQDDRVTNIVRAVSDALACNNPDDPRIRLLNAVVVRVLLSETPDGQ